jgi:hypothetical protein
MRLPRALKNRAWFVTQKYLLLHEQKHHEQISWCAWNVELECGHCRGQQVNQVGKLARLPMERSSLIREAVKITFLLTFFLVTGLVGCTSSKKAARAEGMVELQRISVAVQDMNIIVSAGVTKEEYSKRLTDVLLKIGGQDGGCQQAIAKLPQGQQQSTAAEVCQHVSKAMDAYTYAKRYMGPAPDPFDPGDVIYTLTQEEYAIAKQQFPSLEEPPVSETNRDGYKFYRRNAMVQALWKVAGQESQAAQIDLEKLIQL